MKIATVTVSMQENWKRPNVCTKIMCLPCKTVVFIFNKLVQMVIMLILIALVSLQYGYWLLTDRSWICDWILWQNSKCVQFFLNIFLGFIFSGVRNLTHIYLVLFRWEFFNIMVDIAGKSITLRECKGLPPWWL